jgi:hypothetical protein
VDNGKVVKYGEPFGTQSTNCLSVGQTSMTRLVFGLEQQIRTQPGSKLVGRRREGWVGRF